MPTPAPTLPSYSQYTRYLRKSFFTTSTQHRAYLELILNFVAVAFFGWFAIRPTLITITELISEIDTRTNIIKQLDQKIDALVAADTIYRNTESKLTLLDEGLPTAHQVAQFSHQVETLTAETGALLVSLDYQPFPLTKGTPLLNIRQPADPSSRRSSPSPTPPADSDSGGQSQTAPSPEPSPPSWQDLEFSLTAAGSYPQLRQLVLSLYQNRRIVLIEDLNFQQDHQVTTGKLTLKLAGKVLYL